MKTADTRFWYDDAIFYSIYPLGAVNDKQTNNYRETAGDGLTRLLDWIPHMQKIGCNAVYLAPVFESRSHGYDTTDYRRVDSRLGDNQQLADFVAACHEAGLRVVLDGVFNHTGRDFFAFRDILQNRETSRYRDWYEGLHFGADNPMKDGFTYKAWRNHFELPTLNPHCPAVREYLFETVRLWIRQFDIDGIRLDCADCLDMGFMRDLRSFCTDMKPDFWLMGEIIHGDYNRWVNSKTLHSVTNYECAKGLYSSHNDGNLHEIAYSLNRQFGPGGIYREQSLYNFADNHDLNRLADTVKQQEYLFTIYTLLYTMPGIPSIYYGSEWAMRGVTDRVTDWALRPQVDIRSMPFDNPALVGHISGLAKVRSGCAPLRYGSYEQIMVSSHQFAFRRKVDEDEVIVLINIGSLPAAVEVRTGAGALQDLMPESEVFPVRSGMADVPVPAHGSRILRPVSAEAARKPLGIREEAPPPPPRQAPPAEPEKPAPQPAPQQVPAAPAPEATVGWTGQVRVARRQDIKPEHSHKHKAYEFFRYPAAESGRSRVSFYELPPGKSAAPYLYHAAQDQTYYILEGSGTLRTPEGEQPVAAGDLLFFPAGEAGAHKLTNTAQSPLRYLDFSTVDAGGVTVFPDSGKVGFADGKEGNRMKVFRDSDEAGYYEGE